jgi:hypothetical protein
MAVDKTTSIILAATLGGSLFIVIVALLILCYVAHRVMGREQQEELRDASGEDGGNGSGQSTEEASQNTKV